MDKLSNKNHRRLELSFFGPLEAQFGSGFPDTVKHSIANEFHTLTPDLLTAAACSLFRGPKPGAVECMEACIVQAQKAKMRAESRSASALWTAYPGPQFIAQRGTPEWTLWFAISKALGLKFIVASMERTDRWTMPGEDPLHFILYCAAEGISIEIDELKMTA